MNAWTLLALLCAYVIGSIPTGLWLGLWLRKTDIRQHGSKNIGATNTLRVLGKGLGALALVGDLGKGAVAVLLVARLNPSWDYASLVCGLMAIAGHTFPIFLRFKGGKGVATSTGVFLALAPTATLVAVIVFALVVGVTRMVGAGSICAATAMTIAVFVLPHAWATYPTHSLPEGWALRIIVALVALLIVARHRSNITRILRGEENRL
jgi:acyl phosphate:glycerol-3-phosphate acyltransferase